MKPIKEWLKELPQDIQELALPYKILDGRASCLMDAVRYAFFWPESDEGYDFWHSVANGEYDKARKLLNLEPEANKHPPALNRLSKQIYEANKAKGFWDKERNVGELLMLVTSELGEAMEAHRKDRLASIEKFKSNESDIDFKTNFESHIKDSFEDEIADAIIRLLDMAGGLNIDIDFHITEKLKYNATRERLHGKRY